MSRQRAYRVSLVVLLLLTAALSACNGASHSGTNVLPASQRASVQRGPGAVHFVPFAVVNTGNNSVTIYRPGSTKVVSMISQGINAPKAVAFDKTGLLYVANSDSITVYDAKGARVRTVTSGIHSPAALAFDSFGDLYVANQADNSIAVFGAGGTPLKRTITAGIDVPNALAFDEQGSLYVSNRGGFSGKTSSVTVYAPRKTALRYAITDGVNLPLAIAIDKSGNAYVANVGTNAVTVYPRGSKVPKRTIARGVLVPSALALDDTGNLYVASLVLNRITIYAAGRSKVVGSITKGLDYPNAMAFDRTGMLYVSNLRGNAVTEYASRNGKYVSRVTAGMNEPGAVTFAAGSIQLSSPAPTTQPSLGPQMLYVMNDGSSEVDAFALPLGQYPSPAAKVTNGVNPNLFDVAFDRFGNFFSIDLSAGAALEFTPPYTNAPTVAAQANAGTSCRVAVDGSDDLFLGTCGNPAVLELIPPYTGAAVTLGTPNHILEVMNGMAVDQYGDLFANDYSTGYVLEYQPPISSSSLPAAAIPPVDSGSTDEMLAFDAAGNLFIADRVAPYTVKAYAPPFTGAPFATIANAFNRGFSGGSINAVALDAGGNLFIAGCCEGTYVFAPPYSDTPSAILNNPCCQNVPALAISPSGKVYLYEWNPNGNSPSSNDYVLEYSPPFSNTSEPSGIACCFSAHEFVPFQQLALSPSPPE